MKKRWSSLFLVLSLGLCLSCGSEDKKGPLQPGDSTPPAAASDLAVMSKTDTTLTLSWTATGDDGHLGTAAIYDLRCKAHPWDPQQSWATGDSLSSLPAPSVAGMRDSFLVRPYSSHTRLVYALRIGDAAGNWSQSSNVVDTTTSTPWRKVVSLSGGNLISHPTWSPDGSKIAFSAESYNYRTYLAFVSSSGGPITRVTAENHPFDILDPDWSPDGTKFACFTAPDAYGWVDLGVCIVNVESGHVGSALNTIGSTASNPDWSPDGARIMFGADRIYTVPATGGDTEVLRTLHWATEEDASWSPDGNLVALVAGREIRVYDVADHSGDRVLTDDGAGYRSPCWSPDGAKIAFTSDRSGSREIWVVSAMGDELRRITFLGGWGSDPEWPAWAPDGSEIAFAWGTGIYAIPVD